MPRTTALAALLVLPALGLLPGLLLGGCQGRRLLTGEAPSRPAAPPSGQPAGQPAAQLPGPAAGRASPAGVPAPEPWTGGRPGRGGSVSISARDLAPVDLYVDARNAQWILGDHVSVEASREYFAPLLSVTARLGSVTRTDEVRRDETIITLTFAMGRYQQAVENTPRVMIGTGLTITARQTLRVRLFKTADADTPVALRVVATGDAARGRRTQVEARAPTLQLGGQLRRAPGGWLWRPIG